MAREGSGGAGKPVRHGAVGWGGYVLFTPRNARADRTNKQPAVQYRKPDRGLRRWRTAWKNGHALDFRALSGAVCDAAEVLVRLGKRARIHADHAAVRAGIFPRYIPYCVSTARALDPRHWPAGLEADRLERLACESLFAVARSQGHCHGVCRDPGLRTCAPVLAVCNRQYVRCVAGPVRIAIFRFDVAGFRPVGERLRATAARRATNLFRHPVVWMGTRTVVGAADGRWQLHQFHGRVAGVEAVHWTSRDRQAARMGQDDARLSVGRRTRHPTSAAR